MELHELSKWLPTWTLTSKLTENLRRGLPEAAVDVPWTVQMFLRTKHVDGIFKACYMFYGKADPSWLKALT
jgi:hypothetical protein